ncbi:MAG: hypothetical protein J5706_04010 [Elusimicrobiales bacterium]|nr:hypothetical protein [Elusimicrobiales bacterium]
MKDILKSIISAAAVLMFISCASFTSGEIKVDREIATDMLQNKNKYAYSEIAVSWENYPYKNGSDKIGTGEIDHETGKFKLQEDKPEEVEPADIEKLSNLAKSVFKKAGLYDRDNGKGKLELKMTTANRWNYAELINTYMVDTPFVIILPRALPTIFSFKSEVETSTGTAHIELAAVNKTYFFFLLAPVYPFLSPSSGEKKILNQIMWRMATEIYEAHRKADKELEMNPSLKRKDKEIKAFNQLGNGNKANSGSDGTNTQETDNSGEVYYENSYPDEPAPEGTAPAGGE